MQSLFTKALLLSVVLVLTAPLVLAFLTAMNSEAPHTLMGCTSLCICHAVDSELDSGSQIIILPIIGHVILVDGSQPVESPARALDHPPQLSFRFSLAC